MRFDRVCVDRVGGLSPEAARRLLVGEIKGAGVLSLSLSLLLLS